MQRFRIKEHNPNAPAYSDRVRPAQWANYEILIRSWHAARKTRAEILNLLREDYRFEPSLNQLNAQMKVWNLRAYGQAPIPISLTYDMPDSSRQSTGTQQFAPSRKTRGADQPADDSTLAKPFPPPFDRHSWAAPSRQRPVERLLQDLETHYQPRSLIHHAIRQMYENSGFSPSIYTLELMASFLLVNSAIQAAFDIYYSIVKRVVRGPQHALLCAILNCVSCCFGNILKSETLRLIEDFWEYFRSLKQESICCDLDLIKRHFCQGAATGPKTMIFGLMRQLAWIEPSERHRARILMTIRAYRDVQAPFSFSDLRHFHLDKHCLHLVQSHFTTDFRIRLINWAYDIVLKNTAQLDAINPYYLSRNFGLGAEIGIQALLWRAFVNRDGFDITLLHHFEHLSNCFPVECEVFRAMSRLALRSWRSSNVTTYVVQDFEVKRFSQEVLTGLLHAVEGAGNSQFLEMLSEVLSCSYYEDQPPAVRTASAEMALGQMLGILEAEPSLGTAISRPRMPTDALCVHHVCKPRTQLTEIRQPAIENAVFLYAESSHGSERTMLSLASRIKRDSQKYGNGARSSFSSDIMSVCRSDSWDFQRVTGLASHPAEDLMDIDDPSSTPPRREHRKNW